ncbi:LysR family transcriptional regulator [Actinomadura barringtoniae]|uniref:LysR family transcriptional regulator n=1 Tax=Actinomadura barringtoniae TaxID=1427535 RepID=A0A939PGI0_9ACTN|nr:LysR family transcriptional regulator [Actinomadura barringtoniae]MBO2448066.1 LysR family transcriptional regulator [Actinomadura barringtoniae]
MELRDIEIFLTLAEELHFGRTAERLHVTPARVSKAIKKQERALGVELFERSSRQVNLTEAGRRLADELAPAVRQIREALAGAAASGHGLTGVLRVGWAAAWTAKLVLKAGDRLKERHPGCEIELYEVPLHDRFGGLRAHDLDVQITELPAYEPDIAVSPVIFREPRALLVPADHPFAGREFVTLEDYGDASLITITGPPAYFLDHHIPHYTPSGRRIPRGPATVAWQEVLSLVGAGKGVCPTAVRAGEFYGRSDVVFVPVRDAPTIDWALQWLHDGETLMIRDFVEALMKEAADPVWRSAIPG